MKEEIKQAIKKGKEVASKPGKMSFQKVSSLSWYNYFMQIAETVALRSKDPRTKVGCVIVNQDNHIISTGYNGTPPGFPDTHGIWHSEDKYDYVIHAEMNALLHSTQYTKDCILYTTMFPCKECAKAICSAGISEIYYKDDKYKTALAVNLLKECGILIYRIK